MIPPSSIKRDDPSRAVLSKATIIEHVNLKEMDKSSNSTITNGCQYDTFECGVEQCGRVLEVKMHCSTVVRCFVI